MLKEEDLKALGYEINEDPDQPSRFYWRHDQEGSDISFDTKWLALESASRDAGQRYTLHRCDKCGKVHTEETLIPASNLQERLDPGGTVPSGECVDCGALCYPMEQAAERNGALPPWLEPLEAAYAAATPGKWSCVPHAQGSDHYGSETNPSHTLWPQGNILQGTSTKDALFIEMVHNNMPALIRAIKLLDDADQYLREIRAENLDGSEPALGELLEMNTAFFRGVLQ